LAPELAREAVTKDPGSGSQTGTTRDLRDVRCSGDYRRKRALGRKRVAASAMDRRGRRRDGVMGR